MKEQMFRLSGSLRVTSESYPVSHLHFYFLPVSTFLPDKSSFAASGR